MHLIEQLTQLQSILERHGVAVSDDADIKVIAQQLIADLDRRAAAVRGDRRALLRLLASIAPAPDITTTASEASHSTHQTQKELSNEQGQ